MLVHDYLSTKTTALGGARAALTLVIVALSAFAASACTSDAAPSEQHTLVIAVDRTGVAQSETWSAEVASQAQMGLEAAMSDGVDRVELIGVGSDTDQVATIASADLSEIEGNTRAKRDEARRRLVDDITSAAAQVAASPVDTNGTDVFAAFHQAASLCAATEVTECSVLLLSDLEDQRVTALSSPGDAVDELGHLMPDLSGVSVQVSGLGASGADAETIEKVRTAWERLQAHAGAVDVHIARSL